jgi:hypothetical protein
VEAARGWFAEGVERQVGNGVESFFWRDPWLGEAPLSVRYMRLFDLSLFKSSTVAEMRDLGWEARGAAWTWRQQLWVWEEELSGECRNLLSNIVLQPNVDDHWMWRHDPGGGYTVRGAYNLLTLRDAPEAMSTSDLSWHKR